MMKYWIKQENAFLDFSAKILRCAMLIVATVVFLFPHKLVAQTQDSALITSKPVVKPTEGTKFPTLEEIADKWINKAKKWVEESEQGQFEKVAREMIDDIYKGTSIQKSVDKVIEKYNYASQKDVLVFIGTKAYNEAVKTIQLKNEANAQKAAANAQKAAANAQKIDEMKKKFPEYEKSIISLRQQFSNQPIKRFQEKHWIDFQTFVQAFIEYDYQVDKETYKILQELEIPIEWLQVKNKDKNIRE